MTLIIILVLAAALVLFGVYAFNKLRRADIACEEALGGIDVQLTRRADLIPNLVNAVKGYAAHERGVFDEVTAARAGVPRLQRAARSGEGAGEAVSTRPSSTSSPWPRPTPTSRRR